MDNRTQQELAFLAAVNDSHSIKRHGFSRDFCTYSFLKKLYGDIFEQSGPVTPGRYSGRLQPLIRSALEIRENTLLPTYCDILHHYRENGIIVLPIFDPAYPEEMKTIPDPPLTLFAKGQMTCLRKPAIAVIGTRSISRSGEEKAYRVVEDCVHQGYVIVSGLAHGTDTHAHTAALECGGETIAVLPGGITSIIPRDNTHLASQIVDSGLLLSEVTEQKGMHKGRYIERNRITSGLSAAVVVVETGRTGGSIRQAETALSQGRPVYALKPDECEMDTQEERDALAGYQKLLSMGAIPIDSLSEISGHLRMKRQSPVPRVMTLSDFS
jgi:DNA processing protein